MHSIYMWLYRIKLGNPF